MYHSERNKQYNRASLISSYSLQQIKLSEFLYTICSVKAIKLNLCQSGYKSGLWYFGPVILTKPAQFLNIKQMHFAVSFAG